MKHILQLSILIMILAGSTYLVSANESPPKGSDTFVFYSDLQLEKMQQEKTNGLLNASFVIVIPNNQVCDSAIAYGDVDDPELYGETFSLNEAAWYSFDVPTGFTGDVGITLCSSGFDTQLAIFEDCSDFVSLPSSGMPTNAIAYNDDYCNLSSETALYSPSAGTYYAVIWGYDGEFGTYEIEVFTSAGTICTADADFSYNQTSTMTYYFESYETNFANGYSVEWTFGDGNTSYNVDNATHQYASAGTYDVTQYVFDPNDISCYDEVTYTIYVSAGSGNGCSSATDYGDVDDPELYGETYSLNEAAWYSFDVPIGFTGDVGITLCSSGFDTQLAIFEDCSDFVSLPSAGYPTNAVAYNDDYCNLSSETALYSPSAGTYYAVIWGYDGEFGTYEIEVFTSAGTICTADA
ncbi:MAG: hypothetical protein U9R19_11405, partial [Bacteroidota bacterium]|nr:hypothetical protein [Bacteroidota bacterium]